MTGLAGLLGSSMGGVTADGGGCCCCCWPMIVGASAVGVGGGETGDGSEGHGVDALLDGAGRVDDEMLDDVDEHSEPQREPDSRRWLSMCDVSAAAVLYPR